MVKSTGREKESLWIAADWGSTHLNYWIVSCVTGKIVAKGQKKQGKKFFENENFEIILSKNLTSHICEQEVTDVLCCGMIGSKQGWVETPYVQVPCSPLLNKNSLKVLSKDKRLNVRIIPGLKQIENPDVMRGEETQILGYLSLNPDFEGTICFTGTHTKWVDILSGNVISFETFMTGEMFDLLVNNSMLKSSVSSEKLDLNECRNAALEIFSSPQKFSSNLFKLRSKSLLNGLSPKTVRSRLSGYVIGLELSGSKNFWLGHDVVVVGTKPVTSIYEKVLKDLGIKTKTFLSGELSFKGLQTIYHKVSMNDNLK